MFGHALLGRISLQCNVSLFRCLLAPCQPAAAATAPPLQVHRTICTLGVPCQLEHTEAGEYSIDVAIPEHRIAGVLKWVVGGWVGGCVWGAQPSRAFKVAEGWCVSGWWVGVHGHGERSPRQLSRWQRVGVGPLFSSAAAGGGHGSTAIHRLPCSHHLNYWGGWGGGGISNP